MLKLVQDAIDELEVIGTDLYAELGPYGASIAASLKHDAKAAFDAAVAAGKFAVDTFEKIGMQALSDYWSTCKSQIGLAAKSLLDTFNAKGWNAALAAAGELLHNINWRDVAVSLTGIGKQTLMATAAALFRMLLAGVLVPA